MWSYQTWSLVLVLGVVLLRAGYTIIQTSRLRKTMPPGPQGLPLLGNIFELGIFQWLQFTKWQEQYGPIFSLNLAGQPVVVLNKFSVAADLLDRRSNIYSDRPRMIVGSELLTGGLLIAFLTYGDLWRRMRRVAHEGFNGRVSAIYQPLQEKESALLALHMLRDPDNWEDHLKRSAASTVLCAVYGWLSIDKSSDPIVQRINDVMHRIVRACLPGAHLVEFFPSMLYLPEWMAKWKREARSWFRKDTVMFEGLLHDVKTKMQAGIAEPCFASMLLEDEKKYNLNTQESAWLAGTMFGAGAETTAAALSNFMLAMVLYPDVMRRAQAQIDAVVGRERLPTFSDREQLPFIDAMVKEILRWRPVGPLGLPRRTTQDDWYQGYFIPKGTLVILNVWAMNRDPEHFPDYEEFRPDRYLTPSGELANSIPGTHNQSHLTYGCGRRICVGKDVANQSLFMDFATMLWAFNIEKAADVDGKTIVPSRTDVLDEGLVVRPVPFKCSIKPRSSDVVEHIRSATESFIKAKSS
ncbi:hypothetical protein NM688_g681 [Phlebia brevispora]|uniref:Uncharacterized protein n=1 Tax=Phlebia brevispora TaxID=194682 RepID=A0ACC1TDW3_9APHY|nr:hypothetical protein NM688_g681 [Phlebia brevispora]